MRPQYTSFAIISTRLITCVPSVMSVCDRALVHSVLLSEPDVRGEAVYALLLLVVDVAHFVSSVMVVIRKDVCGIGSGIA